MIIRVSQVAGLHTHVDRVYSHVGSLGCRVAGADALFGKEYANASRDVIDELMELNKRLNEK